MPKQRIRLHTILDADDQPCRINSGPHAGHVTPIEESLHKLREDFKLDDGERFAEVRVVPVRSRRRKKK